MSLQRKIIVEGAMVTVVMPSGVLDMEEFESEEEARARAAIMTEALEWIGTPFRNCADIKGPQGGVDCAMTLVRWHVDTGRLAPFDPRPYSPQWFMHRDEERFLGWVRDKLGGQQVDKPRMGDVLVHKSGRCYAHGSLYLGNDEVVHAHWKPGMVLISSLSESELFSMPDGSRRPTLYFQVPPS